MEYFRNQFKACPRCGEQGYERLQSYDYCVLCNYSTEFDRALELSHERSRLKMMKILKEKSRARISNEKKLGDTDEAC